MKIAFLAPHIRISGGLRIILGYASILSERGHDVTVYVQSTNPFRRTVANIFHLGYPTWVKNFHARVLRIPALSAEHIGDQDVIIATTWKTALALSNFPKEHGEQFFLLQHDEGLYHGEREVVDRSYGLDQKKIVVATWLKDLLREKYGQEAELLLNPIDREQFHPVPVPKRDDVRVLLLDHTYEWKGTKEGIEIIESLKSKHPKLCLVGYGVRREIPDSPYDEYHYDLPQEKLAWLYSSCDIFLCPSWDEGFGLPSIEAMACKTAVVTYDNGGSRDFAFDGKTALVAPRKDKAVLQEKLEMLVRDPELRARIAERGYQFAQTLPTWDEQAMKFEQILKS